MDDTYITCSECNHRVEVSRAREEAHTGCPICGSPWPALIDRDFGGSSLKLRENRSLSKDHKTCPSCHKLNSNDHLICVHCGYDWKTGKTRQTVFQKKTNFFRYLPSIGLVLILLVGGVWLFQKISSNPETAVHPEVTEVPSIQMLQTRDFNSWTAEFNEKHPILRQGDTGKLQLKTGQIMGVRVDSIKNQSLMVMSEQGPSEVQFSDLAPDSRVQVDSSFRQETIQQAKDRIFAP